MHFISDTGPSKFSPEPEIKLNHSNNLRDKVVHRLRHFQTDISNAYLAARYPRMNAVFNRQSGYRVLDNIADQADPSATAQVTIERLKAASLINETSNNVLILGNPTHYRLIMASVPKNFKNSYRIGLWDTYLEALPRNWNFALDMLHEIWTPFSITAAVVCANSDLSAKVIPSPISHVE